VLRRWGLVFLLLPEDMYRGLRTAFYDSGGGFGGGGGARGGWWWRRCSVSPVTRWGRVLINIFLFRFFVHALIVPLGSCERFFCADFIGTEKLLQIPPTTPIMSLRDLET
jgi:hypothetical protein